MRRDLISKSTAVSSHWLPQIHSTCQINPTQPPSLTPALWCAIYDCFSDVIVGPNRDVLLMIRFSFIDDLASNFITGYSSQPFCLWAFNFGIKTGTTNGLDGLEFVSCVDLCKSMPGYMFSVGRWVISWSSKRQPTVAFSTCKAKYVAACHMSKEAIWLQNLLGLIGHQQTKPTGLLSDNESMINVINDPTFHAHLKHTDIQHHFIWEWVQLKVIKVTWVPSADMTADILTKALPCPVHEKLTHALGIHSTNLSSASTQWRGLLILLMCEATYALWTPQGSTAKTYRSELG